MLQGGSLGVALLLSVAGRVVGCGTVTKCAWRVVGCGTVTKCFREGRWVWHCY